MMPNVFCHAWNMRALVWIPPHIDPWISMLSNMAWLLTMSRLISETGFWRVIKILQASRMVMQLHKRVGR